VRRLREQFGDALVAIGVHSAKFDGERQTAAIAQAARRLGMGWPVLNDASMQVWDAFAVRAWPTVLLIDATGRVAAQQAGEIDADEVGAVIGSLIQEAEAAGVLDKSPVPGLEVGEGADELLLRYPVRLCTAPGGRLFVADAGHHRLLEVQLGEDGLSGVVTRTMGTGEAGLADGPFTEARFHSPHGIAFQQGERGSWLWVADAENHTIRKVDLVRETVTTVAGTGQKGSYRLPAGALPSETPLRSPWAVLPVTEQALFIAMAGSHQIWLFVAGDVEQSDRLGVFAGTGAEALVDGPRSQAAFNQPSDLVLTLGHLVVADAEASAIRAVALSDQPAVQTLVGQGLFTWGDVDGQGEAVRLQHPLGLAVHESRPELVYIADAYNHKVKVLDVSTGEVGSVLGTGAAGEDAQRLNEPAGLCLSEDGRLLYIADTNNHRLVAWRVGDRSGRATAVALT
jgi:DNA-binding beta-propeller fold protein YncE